MGGAQRSTVWQPCSQTGVEGLGTEQKLTASQRTNELGQSPRDEHQVGQELPVQEPEGLQLAVCLPGLQEEEQEEQCGCASGHAEYCTHTMAAWRACFKAAPNAPWLMNVQLPCQLWTHMHTYSRYVRAHKHTDSRN